MFFSCTVTDCRSRAMRSRYFSTSARLLRQRRRRAVRIGRARLREQLLLGRELVGQHLAAHVVAALLRFRVDLRKAGGRRRGAAALLRAVSAGSAIAAPGTLKYENAPDSVQQRYIVAADHDRLVDAARFLRLFGERRRHRREWRRRRRTPIAARAHQRAARLAPRSSRSTRHAASVLNSSLTGKKGAPAARPSCCDTVRTRRFTGCSTCRIRPDASSSGSA